MKLFRREFFYLLTGFLGMALTTRAVADELPTALEKQKKPKLPKIPAVVIERPLKEGQPSGDFPQNLAMGYAPHFSNAAGHDVTLLFSVPEKMDGVLLEKVTVIDAITEEVVYENARLGLVVQAQRCQMFKGRGCEYTNEITLSGPALPSNSFLKAFLVFDNNETSDPIYFSMLPSSTDTVHDMVVILPTITWQAYTKHGGHSFYSRREPAEVSFQRPFRLEGPNTPLAAESYLKELHSLGLEFSITGDRELHTGASFLTAAKIWNFPIHSEYWSGAMREYLETHLRAGGHAWITGGNTMWLKVRIEGENVICHKTRWHLDPHEEPSLVTGSFRSKNSVNDPEIRTTGLSYRYGGFPVKRKYKNVDEIPEKYAVTESEYQNSGGLKVLAAKHPVFAGTELLDGDLVGVNSDLLDYEFDGLPLTPDGLPDFDRVPTIPKEIQMLATGLKVYFGRRETVCTMVEFQFEGTGTVMNFGSHGWAFALAKDDIVRKIYMNTYKYLIEKPS